MTIHVVCLDGTGQFKTQPHPTNISRIFDALGGAPTDAGNGSFETQAAGPPATAGKYLPGVGAQGNAILRVLGNAFGDGIAELIVRGYTFLSRSYAAGDEIVITGFSRGAAAARALAGFVVVRGLLDPTRYDLSDKNAAYLRAIAAWYLYRSATPDFASQARLDLIALRLGQPLPKLSGADFTAPPQIRAVGVFDTVSSLGLPHLDSNGDPVFDFTICDTTLNDNVSSGFHALAADETRELFTPTFWAARAGIEQQIFAGAHSNVGGGYPEQGLSDCALDWMLGKLRPLGVALDASLLAPPLSPNPIDIARDDGATFPFRDTPCRARAFPICAIPSAALLARWGQPTEVLPGDAVQPYKSIGTYADGSQLHH